MGVFLTTLHITEDAGHIWVETLIKYYHHPGSNPRNSQWKTLTYLQNLVRFVVIVPVLSWCDDLDILTCVFVMISI